jgi:hypothetical protein
MYQDAERKARNKHKLVYSFFPDNSIPSFKSWKEFLDDNNKGLTTIDIAREEYYAQDAIILFKKGMNSNREEFGFLDNLEDYAMPEDEYARIQRNRAISSFAIIKDGKWYERGEMGWWGMVGNEKDEEVWSEEFTKLFNSISDDTLVTVVDCHI